MENIAYSKAAFVTWSKAGAEIVGGKEFGKFALISSKERIIAKLTGIKKRHSTIIRVPLFAVIFLYLCVPYAN